MINIQTFSLMVNFIKPVGLTSFGLYLIPTDTVVTIGEEEKVRVAIRLEYVQR